ncbi:uncharacterized protein METZ01_LOCUS127633 [marine metagenome]|uniref:Uncharacterized protein n=1 Tax=marine metagenome TaxID=408172 RepID=A0A381YCH1_9ZZZZ
MIGIVEGLAAFGLEHQKSRHYMSTLVHHTFLPFK